VVVVTGPHNVRGRNAVKALLTPKTNAFHTGETNTISAVTYQASARSGRQLPVVSTDD
jgi:hypothetical protein